MTAPLARQSAPLAVSIGDPAGIGPDILLKLWATQPAKDLPDVIVLADAEMLQNRARLLGLTVPPSLRVHPLENTHSDEPGIADTANAAGTVEAIERGVDMVREGEASALVTLPINKKLLYDAGFTFPGHTEYLADLAAAFSGVDTPPRPVMLLAGPDLMTVPITIHIPLAAVRTVLTADLIIETAEIVARDLRDRLGIRNPRLAFSGLNPHAGEEGALGREEIDIIEPALATLRAQGLDCTGPLPADTMFHARARAHYDVALCMYHDQALIPAKALAFDEAVNVTLGLPFIRTSPDHGTAYGLAGTGNADPSSFLAALKMAQRMARAQALAGQTA